MSSRSSAHRSAGNRRAQVAIFAAALAASAAALPAAGQAAKPRTATYHYGIFVNKDALAKGSLVKAKAVVTEPEAKVASWWRLPTVSKVVRKGVNGGYQRPYKSEGYRCGVVVHGETTSFTCTLHGADVPTSVRLTFAVVYRGENASG